MTIYWYLNYNHNFEHIVMRLLLKIIWFLTRIKLKGSYVHIISHLFY